MAVWGNEVWKGTYAFKVGYDATVSGKTTTIKVYIKTRYSVSDAGNSLVIKINNVAKHNGSYNLQTTYNKSDAWSQAYGANCVEVGKYTVDTQKWSVSVSFSGVDIIPGTSSVSGSGTAWSEITQPANPTVTWDNINIIISGNKGSGGINNSVKTTQVFWKWNSDTVDWNNYDDKYETAEGSYKITTAPPKNIVATKIAVKVFSIASLGSDCNKSSGITKLSFSQILAIFGHVPYRFYFAVGTEEGFTKKDDIYKDPNNTEYRNRVDENYINWNYSIPSTYANYKRYVRLNIVEYPDSNHSNKIWHGLGTRKITDNTAGFDLNENNGARIAALECLKNSNSKYWDNGTSIHWAHYYDGYYILETYIEADSKTVGLRKNNTSYWIKDMDGQILFTSGGSAPDTSYNEYYFVGETYHYVIDDDKTRGRIEASLPPRDTDCIPHASYFEVEPLEGKPTGDWSYASNKFKITWDANIYANSYILKCVISDQNDSSNTIKTIEIPYPYDKALETNKKGEYVLEAPYLLAGQRISFSIIPKYSVSVKNDEGAIVTSYSYTAGATSATGIQKQGGLQAYDGQKWNNYHVYVADKNGKPVKARAAYVYSKDSETGELKWRLIKMF